MALKTVKRRCQPEGGSREPDAGRASLKSGRQVKNNAAASPCPTAKAVTSGVTVRGGTEAARAIK